MTLEARMGLGLVLITGDTDWASLVKKITEMMKERKVLTMKTLPFCKNLFKISKFHGVQFLVIVHHLLP